MSTFNYSRKSWSHRTKNVLDLGPAGSFNEIRCEDKNPEEEVISGYRFKSIGSFYNPGGRKVALVLKSDDLPSVLYLISRDYVYLGQIEQAGDLLLQEFIRNENLKYLLIDNTYVMSGWMNDETIQYLNEGWYPGLVQTGVKGIAHLQAESLLGGASFNKFQEDVNNAIGQLANALNKEPFKYYPIKTSDLDADGKIMGKDIRQSALEKGVEILLNMDQG